MWMCYLVSNTRVGSKLQHVWTYNVQRPLVDWYNSPVSRFQKDKEVLEPLTATKAGSEPTPQKMSVAYAATMAQAHALSQVQPA
jgi:hypothetical protein